MTLSTPYAFLFGALAAAAVSSGAAEPDTAIATMRDLCLDTALVAGGQPRAVIVAPAGARYAKAVAAVQAAVSRFGGVALPVQTDEQSTPEELLKTRNVIAFGNMATSRFIRRLYYPYYTFLDLWYPGKGGHVVRSLHNPFGTGHNVVFVGASDDAGVEAAAAVFAARVQRTGDGAGIGRTMEIKLGEGLEPPDSGETVMSWKSGYRKDARGKVVGASEYGWNILGRLAALYYMTGRKTYVREFIRLALPKDEAAVQDFLKRKGDAFSRTAEYGPGRSPIPEASHYHAHLLPLLWDLIEESPDLTDEERLGIINVLRAGEEARIRKGSYASIENNWNPPRPGGRHTTYETLCTYTACRYFAKYYPQFKWAPDQLRKIKGFFSFWTTDTYYGVTDVIWYNTFNESVLDYFLLSGDDSYAKSGYAEKMLSCTWVLWEGARNERSNHQQALSLLRKAAWYLDDPKYAYFANLPTWDLSLFRVGQSYELSERLSAAKPPAELVNRATVLGVSKYRTRKVPFPQEQAYQMLTYRTELGTGGDFLKLDGYFGSVSTEYHIQSIVRLSIAGQTVISGNWWGGYGSQLVIRRDGLAPTDRIPDCAALKRAESLDGALYVLSQVPDAGAACWDRHILHLVGDKTFVIDEVRASEPGHYDVKAQWRLGSKVVTRADDPPGTVRSESGATLSCATPVDVIEGAANPATAVQMHEARIVNGEPFTILNMLHAAGHPRETLRKLGPRSAVVVDEKGQGCAYVGLGDFAQGPLRVKGAAACVAPGRIVGIDVTEIRVGGAAVFSAQTPKNVSLAAETLPAAQIADALRRLTPQPLTASPARHPQIDWTPEWKADTGESVVDIVAVRKNGHSALWTAGSEGKLAIVRAGSVLKELSLGSPIRDLQALPGAGGDVVLAGCEDFKVYACSAVGERLWDYHCTPLERKDWFSYNVKDDNPAQRGVFAIVRLPGREALAGVVSRGKVTVLDAAGRKQADSRFIDHWRAPRGTVPSTAVASYPGDRARNGRTGLFVGKSAALLGGARLANVSWDKAGKIRIQNAYTKEVAGARDMGGKSNRNINNVLTTDLDGDGSSEVLYGITGAWCELRAYSWDGKPLWVRAFGPQRRNGSLFRALDVADIDGDGKQEVLAGLEDGFVYAFAHDGQLRWSRRVPAAIARVRGIERGGMVAATGAGNLYRFSPAGEIGGIARLERRITVLELLPAAGNEPRLIAGTSGGEVAAFGVGP
ncbi:MAG: VCBS repeat-containing protein [Kiritimatiellae bacterium]|nr:VCBS repeat-containing protein [Kiritimatiellia bacterium]